MDVCVSTSVVLTSWFSRLLTSPHTSYDREEQAVFADYLIVMAYDEHYAGSKESGSVASIGFVTKGADDILAENVPSEQVSRCPIPCCLPARASRKQLRQIHGNPSPLIFPQ